MPACLKHSYIHSYVFPPQSVVGKAICPFNGNIVRSVALGQFHLKHLPVLTIHTSAYFIAVPPPPPPREFELPFVC